MKICIIGLPRTRSSLMLETVAMNCMLPIVGEDLNQAVGDLPRREWYHDTVLPEPPHEYINKLQTLIKNICNIEDGVIRLHPDQLSLIPYSMEVLDFALYDFGHYDHICFTNRFSVTDTFCSHYVAKYITEKYTFQVGDKVPEITSTFAVSLDSSDTVRLILGHIFQELVVHELKKFLLRKNIEWVDLEYNDIPDFIAKNFSRAQTTHIKTEYDYKTLVSNYTEIDSWYQSLKFEMFKKFYNLNAKVLNSNK